MTKCVSLIRVVFPVPVSMMGWLARRLCFSNVISEFSSIYREILASRQPSGCIHTHDMYAFNKSPVTSLCA